MPPSASDAGPLAERLPAPDAEARARSARLAASLRAEIAAAGGAIPFARFMERALYAPGLGYYSAGAGLGDDFVTAPEISEWFSVCVARQVAEILERLGGGEVIEAGAGTGAMAAAVLATLADLGAAPRGYAILERSAALRARQRETVAARAPALLDRVRWLDAWPERPIEGVIVANELLDAIPVTRFTVEAGAPVELHVAADGERFAWRRAPFADANDARAAAAIAHALGGSLPEGYVAEIGPQREAWVRSAADRIARGALLLLDYGYPRRELYHPDRRAGTLRGHYRHRALDDPLALVGLQDLSAHVDFSAVAAAGVEAGLEVAGFTTQAEFLIAAGVLDALAGHAPGGAAHARLTGVVKRLTLPGEMGDAVKAMALARGVAGPLLGFAGRDHRPRL